MAEDFAVRVCKTHGRLLDEDRRGRLICAGPRRHVLTATREWRVVLKRTGRALYEANLEKGAVKVTNEMTTEGPAAEPKSRTLERAKFEDGARSVLFIRLTREPKRWGGDPFRVRWQQGPGSGKKGTVAGVAKTCAVEPDARAAYRAAVKHAISQGWKEVPVGQGGFRRLELKPIPAPKKRAA